MDNIIKLCVVILDNVTDAQYKALCCNARRCNAGAVVPVVRYHRVWFVMCEVLEQMFC